MKNERFKDGFSDSAWKSLVVKSLRAGWLDGLLAAEQRIPAGTFRGLLIAGLFEDVFPAGYEDLSMLVKAIDKRDYETLLSYQTHHGRGFTERFCQMEKESVQNGDKVFYMLSKKVQAGSPEIGYIPRRVSNCLYTWYYISPRDKVVERPVLRYQFKGMPFFALDMHTYEGKKQKRFITFLSGAYSQHNKIGVEVMQNGWERIHERIKKDGVIPIQQQTLF